MEFAQEFAAIPIPFRPLDEEQALDWLRSQRRVSISAAELGKHWSWHPDRVRRHLKKWCSYGVISRRGKVINFLGNAGHPPSEVAASPADAIGSISRHG